MRILCLSNFYPPASRGGYEQWCQEVTEQLRNRGHQLAVLTSSFRKDELQGTEPAWIHRDLHLEMELRTLSNGVRFFTHRKSREQENLATLKKLVERFAPDSMLIWGMWNLPRSLPVQAEELMGDRIAYYVGDFWMSLPSQFEDYWNAPPRHWLTALPKRGLGLFARRVLAREKLPELKLRHVAFASEFMQSELKCRGVRPKESRIIYGAIDTSPYVSVNGSAPLTQGNGLNLLYVGRLSPDKGVHTAIEATGELLHRHKLEGIQLSIAGAGELEYVNRLQSLVSAYAVQGHVRFLGPVGKDELPKLYRQADIFLFPSVWKEPFGRVIVEAMASGVPVVGTPTGGAAEIFENEVNALTFPPEDAGALAKQVVRLIESPGLRQRLASRGRQTAQLKFDIGRMASDIESYLAAISR